MAGLKEIKRRLKSVKNTQKITYAMKLVSAAKLRKAQDAVTNSREYTNELSNLLGQLASEMSSSGSSALSAAGSHPLMETRSAVQRVGLLVIGGQRGLCGGYNTNVNRRTEAFFRSSEERGVSVIPILMGRKPAEYFKRRNKNFERSFEELPESAALWPIEEVAQTSSAYFRAGKIDELWVVFTKFKSAISQQVVLEKLLPLDSSLIEQVGTSSTNEGMRIGGSQAGVTLFEPTPQTVFSNLLPRILSARIRQYCLDAKASETAARMTAMDSATKNAKQLGRKLELQHNKIRQARITSELLDIIGGAEAVQ